MRMRILSIETSCDETAAALVDFSPSPDGFAVRVVGERLHSQANTHAAYGGVYPTLAKREHQKILPPLLKGLLEQAGTLEEEKNAVLTPEMRQICEREPEMLAAISEHFERTRDANIDAIAVTHGPGLAPALWVGVNVARTLAALWQLPIFPVNHMEGHLFSALFDGHICRLPAYPLLSLLVSGGHTELILAPDEGIYQKIGYTHDDAAGETFDKVARMLGLPYPGGPEIGKLASEARVKHLASPVALPRPMLRDRSLHFSYAGLKTAVRVFLEKHPIRNNNERLALAMEFEDAVVETLTEKTRRAIERYGPKTLAVGGGVSANQCLRERLTACAEMYPDMALYLSNRNYATDNAVMIALAAYMHRDTPADYATLRADANLSFPLTEG